MPMPAGTRTPEGDLVRRKMLKFMKAFQKEYGYMPVINEIAQGTGMFRNAVSFHLDRLREQGKVDFLDGMMSRTLRLL